MSKDYLLWFLQSQRTIVLASNTRGNMWIANVYYVVDQNFNIYFASSDDTIHGNQIKSNSEIVFATNWYDIQNHANRKGIQGKGNAYICSDASEIEKAVYLHNRLYPEFRGKVNKRWVKYIWHVQPYYIKYWDDYLYGSGITGEFYFN